MNEKKRRQEKAILGTMCQLNIKKFILISYAFDNNEKNQNMFLRM